MGGDEFSTTLTRWEIAHFFFRLRRDAQNSCEKLLMLAEKCRLRIE